MGQGDAAATTGAQIDAGPADAPARHARPGSRISTVPGSRVRQIDVLKGLAIIGVMSQHAFSSHSLQRAWDILHVGQAVPIFFVIMGLNAAMSMSRGARAPLRGLYSRRYVDGRVKRLVLPLVLMWVLAVPVALAVGKFHIGPLIVVGVFPISSAPGNYFVTIVLEFAVLFPAVFFCFTRAPLITTVVIVAANIAFELVAPHISALTSAGVSNGYLYDAAIVKYAAAILAGMWLTRVPIGPKLFWILTPLALASVVYLIVLHQDPGEFSWLMDTFSRSTNFLSVFYAVWLTCLGLRLLTPRPWLGLYAPLERLGQASYHIFLAQIIWFGAVANRSWPVAIAGILVCSLVGHLYFTAMSPRPPTIRSSPLRAGSGA